jgi:DNA-binding PucR family transcriptional regulator
MIHPGLRSLIEKGSRGDSLVQTLEVFLDSAGDVRAASEQLFAHRTSLYYRLRRIQELTGLDLSNGDDRLIAHLGLRIARLTGVGG